MEPVTIGVAIGSALISNLSKKLIEKASDPEAVGKGINWIFSAAENFLKVIRKEKSKDDAISAPPSSAAAPSSISNSADSQNASQKEEGPIVQSSKTSSEGSVKLVSLDELTLDFMSREVISLMKQIKLHHENRIFEEEKLEAFPYEDQPKHILKRIDKANEKIVECVVRLNKCMETIYGVSVPNLEILIEATNNS